MSGGTFNYEQMYILQIADEIEQTIIEAGRKIPQKMERCEYSRYSIEPQEEYYPDFNPETIKQLKRAVYVLRMAYIYARRVDWLLAGDDGEDSFVERLQMELSELKAKYPSGHFTYKARMVKFDDDFSQYKVVDDD